MAKKKKKKDKRKYRYTTGGRVDMRTGGRVKAQRGGLRRDSVVSGKDDAQTKPKNKPISAEGPSLRKPINAELPPKPTNKPISAEGPSLQPINQSNNIVTGGPVGDPVPFNGDNTKEDPPNDKDKDKNPPDDEKDNDGIDETAGDAQGQGQAFNDNRS